VTAPDERDLAGSATGEGSQETAAPSPGGDTVAARRPGGEPEDHRLAYADQDTDDTVADDRVPPGVPAGGDAESAALDADLAATRSALSELTTDLQRLQAEYLNYKRRVERDRELVKQNATFSVLGGLLPVLDDIDRAREHGELEGGFKAVADSLERIVSTLGLTKYGAKGDAFDPKVHEALMHGHSAEVTTTTVDVVAQPGYRIGDRVVRAAKVTVLDPES
jgi:molecular chaperone GrpE